MKQDINMPKLRPQMEKGILAAWLKEPGDKVEKGEALFEVETDKVVNQIEAEVAGTIVEQLVEEGDEVAVGTPIARME